MLLLHIKRDIKGDIVVKRLLFLLASITLLFVLAACGEDEAKKEEVESVESADKANKKEDEQAKEDEVKKDEPAEKPKEKNSNIYFDGKVAQTEKVKIEIKETKVIPAGEAGNELGEKPVFAIWYEVTNLSDEETDSTKAWINVFEVIQDNPDNLVNTLNTGQLPDDAHLDTVLSKIQKGETIESSVSFELDESDIPVTIIAVNGMLGEEIDRHDFEIK